jgi:hypothetical protein
MDKPRGIPPKLLIIDAVGVILAGVGLAGLVTDLSRTVPFLADKTTAGIIAGVGFALVTFALGNIYRWLKMQRAEQASPPPTE